MKNDPFNIFDEAARRSSGIKKKTTPPPSSPPGANSKAEITPQKEEGSPMPSAGAAGMLERARQIPALPPMAGLSEEFQEQLALAKMHHEELVTRLDEIHTKMGMSLKDMKEYLNNPSNFRPNEWELVQSRRAAVQEKILNLLGKEGREMLKKTEVTKGTKLRKGKTLGNRKKWIPIK